MSVEKVRDLADARLDVYARLTEAQLRNRLEPEKGIFIAESFKVIDRALAAGVTMNSLLVTERWEEQAVRRAEEASLVQGTDVPVYVAEEATLAQLTGFRLTRGALAEMRRPRMRPVSEVLAGARRVAVLDGIVDHTNVGAIFRSAAALGMDAVLLTPACSDPLYRRAVRVSMGTVFQIPWARIGEELGDWPEAGMAALRDLGFQTAAMALSDDSISLGDERLLQCPKLAIIMGTEGEGLNPETIARATFTVKIPMEHGVDSLNVAAASAVAFWELRRR